jgi:hypothetical protein
MWMRREKKKKAECRMHGLSEFPVEWTREFVAVSACRRSDIRHPPEGLTDSLGMAQFDSQSPAQPSTTTPSRPGPADLANQPSHRHETIFGSHLKRHAELFKIYADASRGEQRTTKE